MGEWPDNFRNPACPSACGLWLDFQPNRFILYAGTQRDHA
jgi:hypothetical protein